MKDICLSQAWQRPTLPRLKTKYHWRWSDLRPSSRWDRVWTLRQSHQAGERQKGTKHMDIGDRGLRAKARPISVSHYVLMDKNNESDSSRSND